MNIETIYCSGKYLSDNMNEFPFADKGEILFLDKGCTGCGGTTLAGQTALKRNDIKLVILMPSVSSVISKEEQDGFKNNEDIQFLYDKRNTISAQSKVIFATYDKHNIIIDKLGASTVHYKLLIDEYHTPVRDADYRPIMGDMICNWERWESVTLMSASPNCIFEEAIENIYTNANIKKLSLIWRNIERRICITETSDVLGSLYGLINRCMRGEMDSNNNLYIFFNNIVGCNKLIERTGLTTDDYHFLCSKTAKKAPKLSSITDINNNPQKINFMTAAGFEGLDILDPDAQSVLVVDMSAPNTIFDWETIMQMSGRCRNSTKPPHILYRKTKGYRKDMLMPVQKEVERLLSIQGALMEGNLPALILANCKDIICINSKYVLNPFKKAQIYNRQEIFENMQSINHIKIYLEKHGYIVGVLKPVHQISEKKGRKISFQELCEKYYSGEDITGLHESILARNAVDKLGMYKLRELGFKPKMVRRALDSVGIDDYEDKIESIMGLRVGVAYSNKQIRDRIKTVNIMTNSTFDSIHIVPTLTEMGYMVCKPKSHAKQSLLVLKYCQKEGDLGHELYISDVPYVPLYELKCSMACSIGNKENWMFRTTMSQIPLHKPQFKEDQILISECYGLKQSDYHRREESFEACDFMVLDIDNGISIDEFNNYMASSFGNALHYIYPTYSYTDEHPKYRVIIPFSYPLVLKRYDTYCTARHESVTAYKRLKACLFPEFQDANCQLCYYAPFTEILQFGNPHTLLNTDFIEKWIEECVVANRAHHNLIVGGDRAVFSAEQEANAIQKERVRYRKSRLDADKIIENINNAQVGERDNVIFRMVYMHLDSADVDKVRAGIYNPEKLRMYNEKVARKFRR